MFKKLSITKQIYAGFALVVVLAIMLGVSGMFNSNDNEAYKQVLDSYGVPLRTVMQTEVAFANIRQTSRGFVIRITQDKRQATLQTTRLEVMLTTAGSRIDELVAAFQSLSNEPELGTKSGRVQQLFNEQYKPLITNMIAVATTGDIAATIAAMDASNKVAEEIYSTIESIYALTLDGLQAASKAESRQADAAIIRSVVLLTLIVVLSLAFANYLSRRESSNTQRYEAILEACTVGTPISVTDTQKSITYVNTAALNLLNKRPAEVLGRHCGSVWRTDICSTEHCGIEHLKGDNSTSNFQFGSQRLTVKANYLKDRDGNDIGHIEIVTSRPDSTQ